jgi:hypothetical protein
MSKRAIRIFSLLKEYAGGTHTVNRAMSALVVEGKELTLAAVKDKIDEIVLLEYAGGSKEIVAKARAMLERSDVEFSLSAAKANIDKIYIEMQAAKKRAANIAAPALV